MRHISLPEEFNMRVTRLNRRDVLRMSVGAAFAWLIVARRERDRDDGRQAYY